uniref:Protein krueppel n=1 Tax=Anopheles maculatus TaxID=74869 RepID=A0A182SV95_9DIPT
MTEYKCVNFSELCRLCASTNGPRLGIYSDEGRKKRIHHKITESLGIKITESDRLPKSVCTACLKQVEAHKEFREAAVKAQSLLESCLHSRSSVGIKSEGEANQVVQTVGQQQQQLNQPQILTIQNQQQPNQQYTITFDAGTTIKGNNGQYKLENGGAQAQTTFTQVDEFIKIKSSPPKPIKRDFAQNVKTEATEAKRKRTIQIIKQPVQQISPQKTTNVGNFTIEAPTITSPVSVAGTVSTANMIVSNAGTIYTSTPQKTYNLPEVKIISNNNNNRCIVPVVLKGDGAMDDGSNNTNNNNNNAPTISMVGQQVVTNAPQNQQVQLLLKIETGPDGVVRLAPVQHPPLAMQQTAMPQYGMATLAQPVTAMPPMTILGQNQPMVQAQVSAGNYVTLVGKTSSQTQTIADNGAQQTSVVMTTAPVPQATLQPVQQPQQQIQTQIVKKPQPGTNTTTTLQQSQQRAIVSLSTTAVPKTDQRTAPRKAIPPRQATSNPPKLAQATTAPKQTTTVINGQVGNSQKPGEKSATGGGGRVGLVITSSRSLASSNGSNGTVLNNTTASNSSENRSFSDHDSSGNENAESEANRTAQSLVASQQMSAISAMSSKQESAASDQQAKASTGRSGERGGNAGGRAGGDVSITTCDVCRKTFGRKEHLVQHLKSHIGLRPFKCDAADCNKSFSRKEHLLRHTVSHTGQKLFNCDKCHKMFSRKDNLNKHRKTHQEQGNSTTYSCNICNKDFSSKNQFSKHKDTHGCYEEESDTPKPVPKKQSPTIKTETKQQTAANTVTLLDSTVVSKPSQPPPLAHAPAPPVIVSEPTQQATVVQSLPLTITHVPTSSTTIQLPIQQQVHQLIQQQQPQHQNGTTTQQQQQQIFTIPAQIPTANGKSIIQHLQIALPNNMTGQTLTTVSSASNSGTVQTLTNAQGATLASLGAGRATIINSVDGNAVFTLPSNFIFDTSQIITTSRQS